MHGARLKKVAPGQPGSKKMFRGSYSPPIESFPKQGGNPTAFGPLSLGRNFHKGVRSSQTAEIMRSLRTAGSDNAFCIQMNSHEMRPISRIGKILPQFSGNFTQVVGGSALHLEKGGAGEEEESDKR